MQKRLRVLVIAEAANPEWVSVPLVGWSMAQALREVADVHIVTQIRNRDAIVRAGLVEDVDFTTIDTERLAVPARRFIEALRGGSGKGWTLVTAVSALIYPYFERLVWQRFGAAIRRGDYDIVHRVTPLTPTTPSSLAPRCRRAGIPFVLGPLNGGLPWPKGFDSDRRKEREWLSYVRAAYKLLPGRSATLKAASAIIAGSRHTAAEIPPRFADRIVYMPENGIDPGCFTRVAQPPDGYSWGLCFIGRLVPYKAPDMALQAAIPLLRAGKAHFHIIGDGPMLGELQQLVAEAGVADAVSFHGWVAHDQVPALASAAQIFVFPSIREFGGGAVLEAMAMGLVPVVVDYGGPGELAALGGGIAIPLGSRGEIITRLQDELQRLVADPTGTAELAHSVREWALSRMSWSAKARAMLEIYDFARNPRRAPPMLFAPGR